MKVKRYFMKFGEGIAEMPNGEYWICDKQTWKAKPKELEMPPLAHGIINQSEWVMCWKFNRN